MVGKLLSDMFKHWLQVLPYGGWTCTFCWRHRDGSTSCVQYTCMHGGLLMTVTKMHSLYLRAILTSITLSVLDAASDIYSTDTAA